MEPSYSEIQKQITESLSQIREVQSIVYKLNMFESEDGNTYIFVSSYSPEKQDVVLEILRNGMDVRMLSDLPLDVIVAFGSFAKKFLLWKSGKELTVRMEEEAITALQNSINKDIPQEYEDIDTSELDLDKE